MTPVATYYPRAFMARFIFAWLLLVLLYFFYTNSLVHQLQQPVLKYPGSDNSFWLVYGSGMASFFLQYKWVALVFDGLLMMSCVFMIINPNRRWPAILAVAGVWLIYIFYCASAGKHYAQIGYLLTPIPFIFLKENKFDICFNLVRYWICFLYVYAGFSKMYAGGFGFGHNMSNIILQDQAASFVFLNEGFWFNLYNYFIENPLIAQSLYRLAAIIEFAAIIGFFTKKWDKWIVFGMICFHVGNLILLDISFVEQSLIFAPFLPWKQWAILYQHKKQNG